MKIYYTYKITNKVNGKYYYGVRTHDDNKVTDNYMGSGTLIKKAIKKYGVENFIKKILEYFDTYEDALIAEENLVKQKEVDDPMCYNFMVFGGGNTNGYKFSEESKRKISESTKGRIVSKETGKKISLANTGSKRSDETRKKMSEAKKDFIPLNRRKDNPEYYSEESIMRRSNVIKKGHLTHKRNKILKKVNLIISKRLEKINLK